MRGFHFTRGAMFLVLVLLLTSVADAATKEQMYEEMLTLAREMQALKPNLVNPTVGLTYEAKLSRYRVLSQQMGGDDPGHVGAGPATGRTTASTQSNLGRNIRALAAAPPPSCSETTRTFTQFTPTAIPAGPAVVTSTVVVSGAGPYLWDLDLTTVISHTFPGDLDITLTSPVGTVVTLTTDNAGTNDNVFNGTLWDDDANPAGQVPYITNNGLATDNAYANLTLASPLVPEEALAAFLGEDPNGTWTMTISDDAAGDSGSLASWTLDVTTFSAPPTVTVTPSVSNNTPLAIPTGPAVVSNTMTVIGAETSACDVNLTTNLTHTFPGDLDITLTSPVGTVVTLTTDNAGTNDNVFNGTLWDDDANPAGTVPYTTNNGLVSDNTYANLTLASPLVPEDALAVFLGEDPNGTWTMTISDDAAGDSGSLASWTLDVSTCVCVVPVELQSFEVE